MPRRLPPGAQVANPESQPMQTHWSDNRILLRPFQPGDVDAVYEAVRESIVEVGRWLPWCHADYRRSESKAWVTSRAAAWEAEEEYSFGILDVESGAFLGGCGLNHINPATPSCFRSFRMISG